MTTCAVLAAGLASVALLGAACSSGSSGAPTHGAGQGGVDAGTMCVAGKAPGSVPTVTGKLIQTDGTAATAAPKMTGGDATGTWIFDSVVAYLPASANGLVDISMSTATGSAWAVLDADMTYALAFHVDASLSVVLLGPQHSTTDDQSSGTYTTAGASLDPVSTCSTTGVVATYEYTRTGTTGQFLVHTMTKYGQVDLLLGGTVQ